MTSLKSPVTGLMMIASIALLVVLQVLWLRSTWSEARTRFSKETNAVFRTTMHALRDSAIARNIEPLDGDTIRRYRRFAYFDSLRYPGIRDSSLYSVRFKEQTDVVEVYVAGVRDSSRNFLRPLARRMGSDRWNRKFLIHAGPDSLSTDSIAATYGRALLAGGISIPFEVQHFRWKDGLQATASSGDEVVSDLIPFNPAHHYRASFPSVEGYLLNDIFPQILFSVFVTLVTMVSFYAMNKSIRSHRKLVEMKDDLISNISHELKTPVATVSVALEALQNFKALDDPAKTGEYLAMARNELNRLTQITERILQTATLENGKASASATILDFGEVVDEVVESLKLVCRDRNIVLAFEKSGVDFRLQGVRAHLVTVVYNLLDNAIKYSRPGPGRIAVTLQDDGSTIALLVQDTGIGIPKAYRRRVFEKFFRVPAGDVHTIKGYGLGLSYVASVVRNHRGRIHLESKEGEGTRFTIELPKAMA